MGKRVQVRYFGSKITKKKIYMRERERERERELSISMQSSRSGLFVFII